MDLTPGVRNLATLTPSASKRLSGFYKDKVLNVEVVMVQAGLCLCRWREFESWLPETDLESYTTAPIKRRKEILK